MCIFTGPVQSVAATRIFGRLSGARQALAYSMTLQADRDVAMVLPIPVVHGSREDAVRFIDLSAHESLFDDLAKLFPTPEVEHVVAGAARSLATRAAAPLPVQRVGSFEASFVPRPADFSRLDPRFRLTTAFFEAMPRYRDWGFAVFQLRTDPDPDDTNPEAPVGAFPELGLAGVLPRRTFHPMAFEFPTRDRSKLYFPTLHVHDGTIPAQATFDHVLYAQIERIDAHPTSTRAGDIARPWTSSSFVPKDSRVPGGLVLDGLPVHRERLYGLADNDDTWADVAM